MSNAAGTCVPVIDIAPLFEGGAASDSVVSQIEEACTQVGFMAVTGHGISAAEINQVRSNIGELFALPRAQKERLQITRGNYRGYIPLQFFSPNDASGEPDHYEGYKLHYHVNSDDPICRQCELYGPNKWPTSLPRLRVEVERYWANCDRITAALLRAFASILDVESDLLIAAFQQPLTNMTLLHYPATEPGRSHYGIHPHKDTDVFTILAPDSVGGLRLKPRHGNQWIEAPTEDHVLVVNVGDMLELWSGGYLISTPHKVVNPSGQARISFPYFAVPRFDVTIAPLVEPQPGFDRAGIHVGDISREVWRTNWPDTEPQDPSLHLGTLPD